MISDPITNPMNSADEGCNAIIVMSNELSKLWGISYGEFWMGAMWITICIVLFHIFLAAAALYSPERDKRILRWMFWISILWIVGGFLFLADQIWRIPSLG
jgi:hypothetical protein